MVELVTPEGIADRVTLSVLKTGAWRVNKLHVKETHNQRARHNTRLVKSTVKLTEDPVLQDIYSLHNKAFHLHKAMTLPSALDGMRMIPSGTLFDHSEAMRDIKEEHYRLVKMFMQRYQGIKDGASWDLGSLYEDNMFPPKDEVEAKFKFQFDYLPCPTEGVWGQWLEESAKIAQADLKGRLQVAISKVADRCKGGKLYQSVFDNLREELQLAEQCNLTNDPEIVKVLEAASKLTYFDAEHLRGAPMTRQAMGNQADDIMSMFGKQ